ncbi:ERMES complex subunit MDM12 [Aspergillus puulaauensis]|uniref:Mitochondrial distribution and morphology protein 12 n=1 Tax=Aspergillus puulaauensis TaxID=1220207 RepID=A0A7R7XRE3_9EURO|nr:mitochondrial distribution and morphology protein 12 [Aspergillus puulaauensis]BCS26285.1 mitochondrial distribution and morphology protein 12 [Aspergillus puulaauensis]
MSIEVDWRTATSGPDGEALAERIRSFIHDKFQEVPLPRFIRSVQVHSFDFGTVAPDLEIKDFCEPFVDFYEDDEDGASSDMSEELHDNPWDRPQSEFNESSYRDDIPITGRHSLRNPFDADHHASSPLRSPIDHLNPHFLPRAGTPGIPGGTSTLGYHLMSLGGLSGTQTPLAAVAGGSPFTNNWADPAGQGVRAGHRPSPLHRVDGDVDSSNPTSRPSTASTHPPGSNKNSGSASSHPDEQQHHLADDPTSFSAPPLPHPPPRMRERRPEDFQILCHAKYAGDIRLSLTAEILLDYPMPSFVGLPLKLNVTGITFDGVAVIAHIRKRVNFCFLSPEDAEALVGPDPTPDAHRNQLETSGASNNNNNSGNAGSHQKGHGLLQEIHVESEIGRKEDGKQVLKNVGKVERFILAQVRRIFEEELVFPSFYTFLV